MSLHGMTLEEKKTFIHDLMTGMEAYLLGAVEKTPEEWNGRELRQLVSDYVAWAADANLDRREKREYQRVVLNRQIF